jgi:argininosuccinate lyase
MTASQFPHPEYARFVLEPAFGDAQRLLFPHMMAANEAHVLMLHGAGILSTDHAARLLEAITVVTDAGPTSVSYDENVEDLFFQVESRFIEIAGADAGGNLQIARSRNDLDAVMCRLMLRDRILATSHLVLQLRATLIDLIGQHIDTIMPGITHTQPAQPTTLAHYLLGVLGPLERDSQRLRAAYIRVNVCPLGAAAFTTSSFPINRQMTAELLGFDGFVVNGYDAVGAADHMLESTQALVTMTTSLVRFVNDLLIWARYEVGVLRVAESFVQISSIMPQKRNPVVFEHIRSRIGYVLGDANTVQNMVHTAAFGDTVDVEDPIYVPLARSFASCEAVLTLLNVVLETVEINTGLLRSRAAEGFTTSTGLADALVRDLCLPFRIAHAITAQSVKQAIAGNGEITGETVSEAAAVHGATIEIDPGWLAKQLDPDAFVQARSVPGGPARTAVEYALTEARALLDADRTDLLSTRQHLDLATQHRADERDKVIRAAEVH